MTVLLFILGVLFVAVGIALSIALHEVGHLLPAKLFKVRVTQYMVGFGKTLWSKKKGETEYGVKAIPLGGYVSMIGMYPPAKDKTGAASVRQSSTGMFQQLANDARQAEAEREKRAKIIHAEGEFQASQMLGLSFGMKPTALWDLTWRTAYDLERGGFIRMDRRGTSMNADDQYVLTDKSGTKYTLDRRAGLRLLVPSARRKRHAVRPSSFRSFSAPGAPALTCGFARRSRTQRVSGLPPQ